MSGEGESPRQIDCPRCAVGLVEEEIEEATITVAVERCPQCNGKLFRIRDLAKIDDIVEPRVIELRAIPRTEEQLAPLDCPICGQPMEKYRHDRDRQVVVDRCHPCRHLWLDGGELKAIQIESLPVFVTNMARYFRDLLSEE